MLYNAIRCYAMLCDAVVGLCGAASLLRNDAEEGVPICGRTSRSSTTSVWPLYSETCRAEYLAQKGGFCYSRVVLYNALCE
jgi:hypothetical protein